MGERLTPPLKWHGGKNAHQGELARWIVSLMPPHLYYVEPFAGGLAVLLARDPGDRRLWWPGLTSDGRKPDGVIETANDLNGDLVNFYRALRDPPRFAWLCRRLDLTLASEAEWEHARDALEAGGALDPVERAACLFVYNRLSRQALMKDFVTPSRTRLRGGRNEHVNAWRGAIDGLEAVHRRLQDVLFLNRPALDVIRSEDTPATLFYCDPPYLSETRTARQAYGPFEMSGADHRELLDVLRLCRGKVMLSGYASPLYDTALASWNRHTLDRPNNAGGGEEKRRMTEVLWCNF
jgi:DNA adenine methylase